MCKRKSLFVPTGMLVYTMAWYVLFFLTLGLATGKPNHPASDHHGTSREAHYKDGIHNEEFDHMGIIGKPCTDST